MGDLAKLPVELYESCGEIVESTARLLAILVENERVHLLLQESDVRRERQDVLNRAVVQVEAEPHEATFGRRDERPLARCGVLEEALALDHRTERGSGPRQVRADDLRLGTAEPSHDCGV